MPFKHLPAAIAIMCIGLFSASPASLVGGASAQSDATAEAQTGVADAIQPLRDYYAWINQKKYTEAFAVWEKREDGNAANGQSFEAFESGFGDTASVTVEIGAPGEIEGAAGSNFIEIPVVISATSTGGQRQKFAGTYTLRSSNMAEDKSWHIYAARVKKVK
jgi:hypothetical protein